GACDTSRPAPIRWIVLQFLLKQEQKTKRPKTGRLRGYGQILHLVSYVCMHDLLTTNEAATYLRLSPRKLYELLAKGAVPCTKVTGRWLFPRAALDRWLMAGLITSSALAQAAAPPIVGRSHA